MRHGSEALLCSGSAPGEEVRPDWVQPNTTYLGSLQAAPSCCAERVLKVSASGTNLWRLQR